MALEALREEDTAVELFGRLEGHPSQVRTWKKALLEGASGIFGGDHGQEQKKNDEAFIARLYQQIGQIKAEKDFVEGNLGS